MSDIQKLTGLIKRFCEERNWKQFHNTKDLAISLNLEAAEVLEHFQWKSEEEVREYLKTHKEHVGEELSDVLYWILLMSDDLGIDIADAFEKKMKKNEEKYPVEKAKNRHNKYTELAKDHESKKEKE